MSTLSLTLCMGISIVSETINIRGICICSVRKFCHYHLFTYGCYDHWTASWNINTIVCPLAPPNCISVNKKSWKEVAFLVTTYSLDGLTWRACAPDTWPRDTMNPRHLVTLWGDREYTEPAQPVHHMLQLPELHLHRKPPPSRWHQIWTSLLTK